MITARSIEDHDNISDSPFSFNGCLKFNKYFKFGIGIQRVICLRNGTLSYELVKPTRVSLVLALQLDAATPNVDEAPAVQQTATFAVGQLL